MPRRTARDGRIQISVRLESDLLERLDQEAECRVVGRNLLIEKAVDAWLEAHEGVA